MRRVIALLTICALAVLLFSPAAALASSATVVFSGPEKVKAGQTYTYTYKIEVDGVAAARMVPITASGGFEVVSGGEGLMYDTIPNNTSGSSSQGTIVVKVKSGARTGDKCTLSTSGDYAELDEEYNLKNEHTFSGSFIAVVSSGPAQGDTSTPAPAATSSPTPSPEPSASPGATASPVPSPGVSAEGNGVIGASPSPSGGQTAATAPTASAALETTVAALAVTDKPEGGISVVAIVVGALALVLISLVVVFFVRHKRPQGKGSSNRDASAVSADSRTMRRAAVRKKRRRYKH
jgi:hypothetical protein